MERASGRQGPGTQVCQDMLPMASTCPPTPPTHQTNWQAYLNVEAVKGVTRSITAEDANKARPRGEL